MYKSLQTIRSRAHKTTLRASEWSISSFHFLGNFHTLPGVFSSLAPAHQCPFSYDVSANLDQNKSNQIDYKCQASLQYALSNLSSNHLIENKSNHIEYSCKVSLQCALCIPFEYAKSLLGASLSTSAFTFCSTEGLFALRACSAFD